MENYYINKYHTVDNAINALRTDSKLGGDKVANKATIRKLRAYKIANTKIKF